MKTITYKSASVAYSDHGKGSAIVLLHGYLENQGMWQAFIPDVSRNNRMITIDLLGHGKTECLGYMHSMEDQADMVHEVLAGLRVRKAILVGHSMGGYVALAVAELYPEMIKGLVLLNSTSKADSEERKMNRDRAIKAVKKDYTSFIRLSIANLFSEENRDRLTNEIEMVKAEALKTPLQGVISALEGMKIRKDREVLLHTANWPILLVLGKKDPVLDYNETIAQATGTAVKIVSLDSGHMSYIEDFQAVRKTLLDFIKSI